MSSSKLCLLAVIGATTTLAACSKSSSKAANDSTLARATGTLELPPHVGPGVDYVQVDQQPAEKFSLDRAVLTVPTDVAQDTGKLKELLGKLKLNPLASELPVSPFKKLNSKEPVTRQLAPAPTTSLFVGLPPATIAETDELLKLEFPGRKIRFGSERGKRAFGYVLKHRREHATGLGRNLVPDFVVDPTGLFSTTKEGSNFPGMQHDDYWRITRLREAWPLALAAAAKLGAQAPAVTVTIVDQGFHANPVGMVWDDVLGAWPELDRPAYDGSSPWHGTDCGSIVGSAVNDETGAAGTSLLSIKSKLPAYTPIPRIRVVPAIVPAGPVSFIDVGDMIRTSIAHSADVVTVSHAMWCGFFCSLWGSEQDLVSALTAAEQARVTVVFAAGNDSKDLPDAPWWKYLVGCQRGGKALCVGAVDRQGLRMDFSNWGASVVTYAPGHEVAVSAFPSSKPPPEGDEEEEVIRHFSGTSASAPFVAGIVALAEATWGQRFASSELRPLLAAASYARAEGQSTYIVPVLDASLFLRQKLRLGRELEEPNDTIADVAGAPSFQAAADRVYSLDTPTDIDLFPLQFADCSSITVDLNYVADTEPPTISLDLRDSSNKVVATGSLQETGHLHLDASPLQPKPARYYLAVSNQSSGAGTVALPTAYDMTTTQSTTGPCGPTAGGP